MSIFKKIHILNKYIPNKTNILLDYISLDKKNDIFVNDIYLKWKDYLEDYEVKVKFYLHIPFCSRICKYCMYNTVKINKEKNNEIDDYIDDLISYLEKFKNIFSKIEFKWIYIWWWTPSILSEKQMEKLFFYIYKNFKFDSNYYKTIELNPSSTNFKKLDILKKYWFDRISLWIQSFNKKTLDIENRTYVSDKRIKELVLYAKWLWFKDINLDIIAGLNDEWKIEILDNINKLYDIEAYTITVYTILKDMERSIFYKKDKNTFYKEINKLYNDIIYKTYILKKYKRNDWSNVLWFTLDYYGKPESKILYDAHSEDISSLFWVGYKSYSKIWWVWSYEMKEFKKWSYIHKFEKSSKQLEIYKYILQSFQYKIDKKDFIEKFWYEIEDEFGDVISFLENKEIITVDKSFINYIWNEKYIWYYGLLFLDMKNLIKFIKYRFYEKK